MKNGKPILMLIIILVILAIIFTVIIINNSKSKYGNEFEKNQDESDIVIEYEYEKVDNDTLFYTVNNCIQEYFDYISLNINNETTDTYIDKKTELGIETEEEKKQVIYNILDKEYISKNNITLSNIYDFIYKTNEEKTFTAMKMNMLDGDRIQRFVAYGIVSGKEEVQYEYIIVNLDYYNMTYSIEPIIDSKYNDINEIQLEEKIEEISINENNQFNYNRIKKENVIRNYISFYKTNALSNPTIAYNLLDKEYRDKKFRSIEEYKIYVASNKERISSSILESYQIQEDGENTRYICLDTNGNYYIFNETSVMDYTVILDTYTIDLPEFIEKYDGATEQQKVALNIDRFIQAINDGDYKYAYSCLADSYKQNNFRTQEEFEIYAKQSFYPSSNLGFKDFNIQGELYTYSVILTNEETGEQMNKTFIMQLGEGTEFILSFDK